MLSTTIVRGLAATTVRTRSSWSPGSAIDVRSSPSVSQSSSVPTIDDATSALGGQRRRPLEVVALRHGPGTDDEPADEVGFSERVVDGRPRTGRSSSSIAAADLRAADAEEGAAVLWLGELDDGLAVERARPAAPTARQPISHVAGVRPGWNVPVTRAPNLVARHAGGRRLSQYQASG